MHGQQNIKIFLWFNFTQNFEILWTIKGNERGPKLVLCGVENKKVLVKNTQCQVHHCRKSFNTTGFETRVTLNKFMSVITYMARKGFQKRGL